MRDISNKADGSDSLTGGEFNSVVVEIENIARRAGISLDAPLGPDTNLFMLAEAFTRAGLAATSYQDSGAANAFVLTPVQTFEQPSAYFDGMTVSFKAATTNTDACVINANTIGSVEFTQAGGTDFTPGIIGAGNNVVARFFQADNRFELISNTTPELSGPASPDQVAVYADSGSASQITLTIEPGYIRPSAFTDQMVIMFKAAATNDGNGTHPVNVVGLGSKNLVETDGTNPVAGRITTGAWVMAVFREVRDALEIAFVAERPKPDLIFSGITGASSNVFYAVNSLTESRAPTEYVDGMTVIFRAPLTNGGSVDMEIDGLGQRDMRNLNGANFAAGQIPFGAMITAQYEAGNDRFRAAIVPAAPVNPLSATRSAEVSGPSTTTISSQSTTVLNFLSPPASDPFGFYDAAKDTFEGVAGVEAVDVVFNLQGSFQAGDTDSSVVARITVNGVEVASQSARFAQGVEHANLFAMDVPVSAGQTIEATVTLSGSANYTVTSGTKLTVRASRLAA